MASGNRTGDLNPDWAALTLTWRVCASFFGVFGTVALSQTGRARCRINGSMYDAGRRRTPAKRRAHCRYRPGCEIWSKLRRGLLCHNRPSKDRSQPAMIFRHFKLRHGQACNATSLEEWSNSTGMTTEDGVHGIKGDDSRRSPKTVAFGESDVRLDASGSGASGEGVGGVQHNN